MAFISKLQSVISNIQTKKGKPIDISKITTKKAEIIEQKKLTKALDGLALANKGLVKQTATEGYNTFRRDRFFTATETLLREQAESGSTAQEAVNGARAAVSATNMPERIYSALQSAKNMEELGLFRKMDLQEKYGEKLAEKKARIAAEKTFEEAKKILAEEMKKSCK